MEGYYSVREMTRRLGVEAHMLRYWEKELKLDIARDSQGHRIYGEEEAQLLARVSEYKKQGKPLRLIRTMITLPVQEKAQEDPKEEEAQEDPKEEEALKEQRLQELLSMMIAQAVRESSETMITEMKESILKELDYQFRQQAEREEELRREIFKEQEDHFQRLDVLLRNKSEGNRRKWWR